MKKILFVLMLLMASVTSFAQSKTYKVKQGETIESIAHKHGISVNALIQANPQAAEGCYTGMTLIIPSGKSAMVDNTRIIVRGESSDSRQGKGTFTMELEFQYVMISGQEKDLFKDFNCGMSGAMGYRYYLHNNFFVEGLFGYRWYSLWMVNDASTTVHSLTLPIHIGGYIDVSDKFALRPFFGPRVDIPVSSKVEYKGKSQSADVDPGVTLEFGLDFQFNDTWGLRAKYGLGVGGYKNQNYVSLGFTVGI